VSDRSSSTDGSAYDLGVDLGTTYTCAARSRDGRIELVQLGHTSPLVPSVVSIRDDDAFVVGEAAERRAITDPSRTVREFKRRLGDEAPYVIGGKPFGAEVLAAELLANIVKQVEAAEGQPARRVALTHPANYGPFKLGKLRDAAARAGVAEPMLVPEPVAAALSYADRERVPAGGYVLVYDLGGGTFDVAVVQMNADGPAVVGTPDGLERLGGIDFDAAVLNHVDRALEGKVHAADTNNPETRAALARLREECRSAKEALSSDTETQIPVLLPDVHETVRLTRGELEQMLRPRLEDTFPIVERVVTSAGITMAEIAAILTVGGSSRIPLVAQLLRERTQRPVAVDPNPKASVALGAAAVAAWESLPIAAAAAAADPTVASPALRSDDAIENAAGAPPKRRRRVLVAAIVALALVGGGTAAAFALGGSSGTKHAAGASKRAPTTTAKHTTSTTKKPTATTTTAPLTATTVALGGGQGSTGGGHSRGGGSSGGGSSGGGSSGGGGGSTGGTAPPNTAPPRTNPPTTTTTLPKPTISAHVTNVQPCFPSDTTTTVDITWSSTHATTVNIARYPGQLPNGAISIDASCATNSGAADITAVGPGGEATTTVSWTVPHAQN
jgi:actin-like ATPase involved in cell morphogenesis